MGEGNVNFTEGLRRLGLVAGILGAGAGTILAHSQLQALMAQRSQNRKFQELVSSRGLTREVEMLKRDTKLEPGWDALPGDFFDKLDALCGDKDWQVNRSGIRTIHISGVACGTTSEVYQIGDKQYQAAEIRMIETADGQIITRTNPPGFWAYIYVVALPVLGFLLPWGAIRLLTWVAMGFFAEVHRPRKLPRTRPSGRFP